MDDIDNELRLSQELESDSFSTDSSTSTKKTKLPLPNIPMVNTTKYESGFHTSTRLCLVQIREALMHHRWEEAAKYMAYFPQILEDTTKGQEVHQKELLWRMAIEILHHHPNAKLEDYNNIYQCMKSSGVKHYLQLSLEHSFHLLLMGHFQEAKNMLSIAESWRHGKETAVQSKKIYLIQAYRSLLDYMSWREKKEGKSSRDFANIDDQSMHNYFKQASVNLKDIFKQPGVWDPFILCYVEMCEFYEDYEEAERVLNDYAYDSSFPPNPNAHVYLYQYLKRHNAPEKKLIKVLKILQNLVPSHPLMTDYCSLLLESGKTTKALGVTLDMLDYACWKKDLDIWKTLQSIIKKLQSTKDWEEAVSEVMSGRKDWWPALHFTTFHAAEDERENPELRRIKAPLAKILCPDVTLRYCNVDGAT